MPLPSNFILRPFRTECCINGHPRRGNTAYALRANGTTRIYCRVCHRKRNLIYQNDRYRHDDAFRKAKAAKALAYYHRTKRLRKDTSNASV